MFCIYLDAIFLSGWLDDIGLPQYKTQFDEGRVDGRMLHYMTVVSVLKVIHAVSHHKWCSGVILCMWKWGTRITTSASVQAVTRSQRLLCQWTSALTAKAAVFVRIHTALILSWTLFWVLLSVNVWLCLSGWSAFSESGKCPASPQYQESHPSAPTEQLWAQLLASSAIWWGAAPWKWLRVFVFDTHFRMHCWMIFSSSVSLSTEQYFSSRDFPVDQP